MLKKLKKMIRKSEHMEYIDKYLSQELTGDELREFNAELAANQELEEEMMLLQEIEQAVQEQDVMSLRDKLDNIAKSQNQEETENEKVMQSYDFELSENLSSFNEFKEPVTYNDLKAFAESLPVLHLAQHKIAEKENIHQFYKEQNSEMTSAEDEVLLTPQDEAIFKGVEDALAESDILDLRENLKQIAANLPAHERSSQEIEQYIDQDMDESILADFEKELQMNAGLAKDVELYAEINNASAEADIINLRNSLGNIQQTEVSTARKAEEIDQYLRDELSEDERLSFESELSNNPDLAAELKLHAEIDSAISETDILNLRAKLGVINKEITREKGTERSFVARFPNMRVAIGTVAASLILIISVAGLISKHKSVSEAELYTQYYKPYEAAGIFRSGNEDMDDKVSLALNEFNSENYQSALTIFNQILSVDQDNAVGYFYSGMAYQETNQYNEAVESYQKVAELKNNLFVEQAEWYTGLCYLRMEDKKKAYDKFKKIAESKGYYSEQASAILRKINYIE